MSTLVDNYLSVRRMVAEAAVEAGRSPEDVKLLAVSKTFPAEDVREVFQAGQACFGENRVQELEEKSQLLPPEVEWHLIGHLQLNKVRAALETASWIHSVDSLKLLKKIQETAAELNVRPKLLLEVNISGEPSKFGFDPELLIEAVRRIPSDLQAPIVGLMTMAPMGMDEEILRLVLGNLVALRGEALCEVAVTVEKADSHEVDIHVGCLLEVVAGKNAQTSGVNLEGGVQTVFHAEVSYRRFGAVLLLGHISIELRHYGIKPLEEVCIFSKFVVALQ